MVGQAALDYLEEVIQEDEEEAGEVCGDVALVDDLVDGGEDGHRQPAYYGGNRVCKNIPSGLFT